MECFESLQIKTLKLSISCSAKFGRTTERNLEEVVVRVQNIRYDFEGQGEMFEGDSADMCAGKFQLVSMRGRGDGQQAGRVAEQ